LEECFTVHDVSSTIFSKADTNKAEMQKFLQGEL
jgi:hypothetical protein